MASARSCAALVDELPALSRARRELVGPAGSGAGTAVLKAVAVCGSPRVSEVAEQLGLDLSTVSRQVAALRAAGLLRSTPDPADARSHRLHLSAEGLDHLRAERDRLVERLTGLLGDWDDEEVAALAALLRKLAAGTAARCRAREDAAHHPHPAHDPRRDA